MSNNSYKIKFFSCYWFTISDIQGNSQFRPLLSNISVSVVSIRKDDIRN